MIFQVHSNKNTVFLENCFLKRRLTLAGSELVSISSKIIDIAFKIWL